MVRFLPCLPGNRRMSESGPEAVAERNHAGPSVIRDLHSMSESGPETVAERNHAGPSVIRDLHSMNESSETRVYGIRHHGPGSARSLRSALEEFRPDMVLIEGPADADQLVPHIAADTMEPPVALLGYVADEPARAAFWPYAVFSPEWQALRYAVGNGIPVRFCDLPASVALAVEDSGGGRDALAELAAAGGYDDAERWWDAVVESSTDAGTFPAITEAMAALRDTARTELPSDVPATGCPDRAVDPTAPRD